MTRSLADCSYLIEARAIRLVRLHVRGRQPQGTAQARNALGSRIDRAFDLLIAAVEERDRAQACHDETMANYRRRADAGRKAWQTRRRKAAKKPALWAGDRAYEADRRRADAGRKETPVIKPADLTDEMIREQRSLWLTGPATAAALTGVVACNDALGRSHRRSNARQRIAAAINARNGV